MNAKVGFFADVVQTGTVLGLDANLGPDVAAEVMGGVGGVVTFDELAAELGRRRVELVAVGGVESGHQLYWQPDAQVTIYVGVDPEFRPGGVRKIFTAFGQDLTIAFDGEHRAVWRQVKALAVMPVEERIRWVERQAPEDFRSWWRYCARLLAARTASHDELHERPKVVELAFWMWDHGVAKGVYTPKEVAYLRAGFAARVEELYPELALPSHDELVGACLDHVSEPLARDDKNLVDAARLLRHGLRDTSRFDAVHERRRTA